MHEKLDRLVASSSSSHDSFSEAVVKALMTTFVKEHEASIAKATSAIDASTKSCKDATEKVKKLILDANVFLESLQGAAELNANKVNSTVEKLAMSLETEKKHFATMCQTIQGYNVALRTSVNERLQKLQEDLAMESRIMDELALKKT